MREITTKVYRYSELSDRAKEKAREWYLSHGFQSDDAWECIQEDAKNVGLIILSLSQHGANTGRFERFAENTAERIMKEHGLTSETYQTAKNYVKDLEALKRDDDGELFLREQDTADELGKEFLHDILEDYRIMMENDVEYRESEESVKDMMEENAYEFTEYGTIA